MGSGTTTCIDEPDNFVSLREVQPWLHALVDHATTPVNRAQVVLVSHHPELLNLLAREHGIVFVRTNGGPVLARPYSEVDDTGLLPSEAIARGWLNE